MSNIHGLYSNNNNNSDDDDDDKKRESRYVGGVDSRGGGSGLAVEPTNDDDDDNYDKDNAANRIFQLAQQAGSAEASNEDNAPNAQQAGRPARRTIIMYRNGFQVDEDGPYRRLDDPANADFLRSLAMGRVPRELASGGSTGSDVTVNLVDKRSEDYVETFRSFSGVGTSLGSASIGTGSGGDSANQAAAAAQGVFDPETLPPPPSPPFDESQPTTSIQVRLLNGKRKVIKVNVTATVATLASLLASDSNERFRLVTGFPPAPLVDGNATMEQAGLKGAQVMMKRA